ncbi:MULTISPECIES: ROK family protein [Amycolatopsis]|uniref:Glucokinase n=2 Tax=Amycolatopsis TaxID=1813 RepID=A0A1I3LT31_9PSEU|nr:ROK family protein [Amycolatopsis sacchari]SFI87882.1 glucokinase [Amycolatopsis sacchari]
MTARFWAGLDIGGSKTLAVLCDERGEVVAEAVRPTPATEGGESILDIAAGLVRSFGVTPAGIGVGAAGVVDPNTGTVLATGDSFTGWAGTAINAGLSARLGVPARAENDVRAFLLGEAAGLRNALGVTLGTGVGGALLVDGRLLRGRGAGEIGHVGAFGDEPCSCGQRGHLEAYASGRSLSRRYAARTGASLTAQEIAAAAEAGDAVAAAVYEEAGRHLGSAVAQAGGLLGLDLAILGGSVVASWPLLEKAVLRALEAQPLLSGTPVRIRLSRLGSRAVALGAVRLVRE